MVLELRFDGGVCEAARFRLKSCGEIKDTTINLPNEWMGAASVSLVRVGSGLKRKCIICGEKKVATNEKHDATINLPRTLLVSKASLRNVDEKKRMSTWSRG